MKFWIAILFTAALFSCKDKKPESNVVEKQVIKPEEAEDVVVAADIIRLDKQLFAMKTKEHTCFKPSVFQTIFKRCR
jgi:hypothetical protein